MDDYEIHLVDEVLANGMTRRDLIRRATVAGLSMSSIAGLLSACGGGGGNGTPSAGPIKRGGSVRIATNEPSGDVEPVTMSSSGAVFVAQMALDYLIWPRPDFSFEPRLATGWKARKPDEWRVTLRKGVTWQDGKPLTADDVVWTFDLLSDPKGGSAALSAFTGILSKGHTEKVDAHTVVFHLDRGYVDFPSLLSSFNPNACILPNGYEVGQFAKGGIGTGAFTLEKLTPKVGAEFKKNPRYWRGKSLPYLDSAQIKYFANTSAAALAMQGGEVDIYPQLVFAGAEPLIKDPNLQILQVRSNSYRELFMRVDQPPFDDKRVRQALALCIDRDAVVKGVMGGYSEVANDHGFAPIFPGSPDSSSVPQRKQDYAQAKQLLAQAGHPRGFSATLTTENVVDVPDFAVTVKQQCHKVGIDLDLKILSLPEFYGSGDNMPWLQVPLGCVDWNARGSSSQLIQPAYTCGGVWNSAHWCEPRFDAALTKFEGEVDEQRRRQLATEAASIQNDAVPAVNAYWLKELRAASAKVHGLAQGPSDTLDVSEVWVS